MSITITHTTNKKEYMRNAAKKFYDKNSVKIIEYKKERYRQKFGHLQPLKKLSLNGYTKQKARRLIKEKIATNKLNVCIVSIDGETNILSYMDFYKQYEFNDNEITLDFVDNSNDELMLLVSMNQLTNKKSD
jgi:hypothetical protein